MFLRMTPTDR